MGLSNNQPQSTYVTCSNGKIRMRLNEPCEGSTSRKLTMGENAGQEVHELVFDKLDGYLRHVELKEGKYGDQWVFVLEDADTEERFTLQFGHTSTSAMRILNQLLSPAFDPSKVIVVKPYDFIGKDGKQIVGVNIFQGEKLPFAYGTNSRPIEGQIGEMPDWVLVEINGKPQFDKGAQLKFLAGKVAEVLAPKINALKPATAVPLAASLADAPKVEQEEFDDVPF